MSLRYQRLCLIQQIIQKDPKTYGYLSFEPFNTYIIANWKQFPNQFIRAINDTITQFGEYHSQVLLDKNIWGNKYKQFQAIYLQCYQIYYTYQNQQIQQVQVNMCNNGYNQSKFTQNYEGQRPLKEQSQKQFIQEKMNTQSICDQSNISKNVLKPTKFSLNSWTDKENAIFNKNLIQKVNDVNAWTKRQCAFQEKNYKPEYLKNQKIKQIKVIRDKKEKQTVLLDNVNQCQGVIKKGLLQTCQARKIKQQIKKKAAKDFATLMEKQNQNLDKLSLSKKQIIYNLNLLAPQNIDHIKKDLQKYLFTDRKECLILTQQIIQKAIGQPKYASTYAKLCQQFCKFPSEKFNFQNDQKGKKMKSNPFKILLISEVQQFFEKKEQQNPQFKNDEQKVKYLNETKKRILGNIKLIAQLILSKVLNKKIIKICISKLIFTFLGKYYNFRKTLKFIDSYYDYYFEALIQFVQSIGQIYEKVDQNKQKAASSPRNDYEIVERIIINLIQLSQEPPKHQISQISQLNGNEYFKLFKIIDKTILKQNNPRLSALLLNLEERRAKNWQNHHSESQKPRKLQDIKQEIAKQEQIKKKKAQIKQLQNQTKQSINDLVQMMYKDWENDKKNEKTHFKTILKGYTQLEFIKVSLIQLADEKKQKIRKRIHLFEVILQNYFNIQTLKSAWIECAKFMALNSGDYPFCSAAIALVLKKIFMRQPSKIKDFYFKTSDEDQELFINQVYGKLYHYTKWLEINGLMTPSQKYRNTLEEQLTFM